MAGENGYTPTQQRMLKVLSDGAPHAREELHACLVDEMGDSTNIHPHLTGIRKHLRPIGQDIICQYINRQLHYRHIRLLSIKDE